ncbi:sensor histidine kinase [Nocardia mangyaensis]|uniref:sensor histidine kinase n=1 Tax=Nocardia mangyaensis TaxID=2213200 RepID=UPI002676434F|nr:nitrate- and nitrite sensing domain-containing protein [Nocardia mangyaensis]MDO3649227.1 nitrate- and nitrite sensing domain-containing protein [Nocardia mangyaensis]
MRARSRPDRTRIRSTTHRVAGTGLIRPRTISGQLARILAVSLVLVLALLGLTVSGQIGEYRRSGQTVDAVVLALAAQDLVHELQRERGLSNGLLGGDARLGQSVLDQRTGTDHALRNLSATVAADPPGASEVSSALGHLTGLPGVRSQIDTRNVTRSAAFQFYTDGIDAMNRLFLGLDQARDPQVRHGLQALYALGDAKEFNARERGFLNGVFAAGEFAPGEYVQFLDIRAARTAALTQFGRDATVAQRDRLDMVLAGENAARAAESENIAIASTAGPLTQQVDPAQWWAQMTAVIDDQRAVQQAIGDDIRARAQELRREAALLLAAFALATLLAIAAEFALVFASIRAIVRPLARLAAEADDVASARLPEVIAAWRGSDTTPEPPAPVRTPPGAGVEIAAVAGALDRVQTTAFELASEQALVRRNTTESMANLARRNQNLVRRQLGLISEFEREELDPKALSNLFELDHLATRMRRNAESLLVLVGEASPRRWAEPIALSDVIRAGLSEVDDYRRVALRRVDDIAVTGAVVSELAHILAELIENGLAFSPPDLEVEVYGRRMAGGYLLAVVDHGVGMPADALAEANARLRGEQDFIVASTRYLGHYVVGRLASRLDISVELTTSPVSGIVARLLLPPAILADDASSHPAGRPDTATRATHADSLVSTTAGEPIARRALPRSEAATGPLAAAHSGGREAVVAEPSTLNGATAHPADSVYAQFFSSATASVGAAGHADDRTSAEPGAAAGHSTRTTSEQISGRDLDDLTRGGDVAGQSASADIGPAIAHRQVGEPAVVERTRNGLVKRAKRAKPPGSDRPHRDPGPHQDRPPALDRTPDQTRSMLASFRTGHERGGLGTELSSTPAEHTR